MDGLWVIRHPVLDPLLLFAYCYAVGLAVRLLIALAIRRLTGKGVAK